MRSRRLTDMLDVYRQLLDEGVPDWNLPAKLFIGEHHLFERVAQHGAALFKIFALGNDFRPLNHLAHVAGGDFGVFGGVIDHDADILNISIISNLTDLLLHAISAERRVPWI